MPERSVTVRISATDNFSQVVDNYNQKMGAARDRTREMGERSDTTGGKVDGLSTLIKGAFTIALAKQIANVGLEMVNVGTQVTQVKERFEALVGPMGDAEDTMKRLQEATLGIASDFDIQKGANILMQMGLAKSPEELEQIIGLITRIKKPTDDLGTAIQDFSLLLSNQSILRLDNFGLSSARVRERIHELLASGEALNRSDAFKMAVLEEGAKSVDRLGASAENARTPIALLETKIQNLINTASVNVAEGAQGLVGIAMIATGNYPGQQEAAKAAGDRLAADLEMAFGKAMTDPALAGSAGSDQSFVREFMQKAVQKAIDNPELAADAQKLRDAVLADMGVRDAAAALEAGGSLHDLEAQLDVMSRVSAETVTQNALARETMANQIRQTAEAERQMELAREQVEIEQRRMAVESQRAQLIGGLDYLNQQAVEVGFQNFTGTMGFEDQLPDFMTSDQADRIAQMADETKSMADEIDRLSKVDPEMFTADEIQNAKDTAATVKDLASEAEKAADAFERIQLTDIFGQTSGGTLGEIGQMVLGQFQGSEEQKAALQRQLELQSGQVTQGSLFLQEVLVPEIAKAGDNPELAAAMAAQVNDLLLNAALAGVDTNDPEFLAKLQEGIGETGLLGLDTEKLVTDFSTAEEKTAAMAEQTPVIAEKMTIASEQIGTAAAAAPALAEGTAGAAKELASAADSAKQLKGAIHTLTSTVHKVKVQIDVTTVGDDFQNMVAKATRSNGGKPPGAVE